MHCSKVSSFCESSIPGGLIWIVLATATLQLTGCTSVVDRSGRESEPDSEQASRVEVWWSSELLPLSDMWFTDPPSEEEIPFRLSPQDSLIAQPAESSAPALEIVIDPSKQFQDVLGIGIALEDTTLYALRKNRTREQIKEVIRSLIDPVSGAGFSLFRLTIGTSDFSDAREVSDHPKGFYTYRERESDQFSIEKDHRTGIIETIKLVQEVAAETSPEIEIKFFASCWSPPAWMKTSNALIGGTLKTGYERELARYFRQFIEAYAAEGIPIYAMTMQNEPNFSPPAYPGMILSPQQELELVKAVWEEFHSDLGDKPELQTKLWINDHNFSDWERADFILGELKKEGKLHYVDATAFHNYDDAPASNMSKLKEHYPETSLVFTEHSEWGTEGMYAIQEYFWNWSQSYMYWVAATTRQLDEHNQSPYNRIGELSPTLLIEKDPDKPGFYRTPEFYLLAQFARFVRPGAVMISCDRGSRETVTAVSFLNPSGSVATILVNQTSADQQFQLRKSGQAVESTLPAGTVGTYLWPAD